MKRNLAFFLTLTAGICLGLTAGAQNPDTVLSINGPLMVGTGSQADYTFDFDNTGPLDIAGWSWGICEQSDVLHIGAIADGETTLTINGGSPPAFNAPAILADGWTVGVVINFFGDNPLPPGNGYELHVGTYDALMDGTAFMEYCDTLGSPIVETVLVDSSGGSIIPSEMNIAGIKVMGIQQFFDFEALDTTIFYDIPSGVGSGSTELTILESDMNPGFPNDTQGFSMGLGHDSSLLTATSVDPLQVLNDLDGGSGPDFFGPAILADGITVGVVYEFLGGIFIQFGTELSVVGVGYDTNAATLAGDMDGEVTDLTWDDTLGTPPVENVVVVGGLSIDVQFDDGVVTLIGLSDNPFVRGDCNSDSIVNIADGIWILNDLFQGGPSGPCAEACNANDDGVIMDASDAVYIFMYRFLDGPTPPAPFPSCGAEPGADCAQPTAGC